MDDVTMNEWEVPGPADTTASADAWGSLGGAGTEDNIDFFAAGFDEADTTADAGEAGEKTQNLADGGAEEGADTTAAGDPQNADTTAGDDRAAKENNAENNAGENEQTYTLKICGREQKMSLPEVLALAQKGGDYDRVRENYDSIKADAHRLQEIARASGKSTAELLDTLGGAERQAAQEEAVSRLVQGGLDEGVARVIGEMLTGNDAGSNARNNAPAESAADDSADDSSAVRDSIKKLVDVYGISELPQEVIQMSVDKGLLPFEAYQAWKIAEGEAAQEALRQQLAAEQKNRDNRARGVGSLQGAGEGTQDAFLAGFDAD